MRAIRNSGYLVETIEQQRRMFNEQASVLVLTYTSTLATALKQLYQELYGDLPRTITIDTFSHWMMQQLRRKRAYTITPRDERTTLVRQAQQAAAETFPDDDVVTTRPPSFLLGEIDEVIRARGLESLQEYQLVNRVGRGIGLDREHHRPILWRIYELYEQSLKAQNFVDFAALPSLVMQTCDPLPKYDVVIIDEAQDLPPIYLRLVSGLIADFEESRSLTLLADPAQSIYYRGISWKEGGINVRGSRTRTLAKNFRNT
jgi:superfamily I DNA/RNA helicase